MFVSDRASDISKCFVNQLPAALDRYLTALPAMYSARCSILGSTYLIKRTKFRTLREFRTLGDLQVD